MTNHSAEQRYPTRPDLVTPTEITRSSLPALDLGALMAIASYIQDNKVWTVDMLVRPRSSTSTVRRSLHRLAEQGLLVEDRGAPGGYLMGPLWDRAQVRALLWMVAELEQRVTA